jgi:PAS domain S-box-containing protein
MLSLQHNEILKGMFNDATEGIIVSNTDGRLILANPKALLMFGYTDQEMLDLSIEDLVPPRYKPKHNEHRAHYNENPSPRAMGVGRDLSAIRKDGHEFPIEISLSYVKSLDQTLIVSFVIDITERKRKDSELRQANELLKTTSFELSKLNQELEQKVQDRTLELADMIQRLTDSKKEVDMALEKERALNLLKSRFISTASHEFRTPLATIMSSVSLAGRYAETLDKNNMIKHIERVKNSVNHLTEILNDLLSLDKLEEGGLIAHPEYVSVNALVTDVIEEMRPIAKAGQRLLFQGLSNQELIFVDKRILKNILINMISNAIKYSNDNTSIDITLNIQSSTLSIDVKDHGVGIPLEDQPHIFERFYRANNSGNMPGTGLGLSIVKKYVEILNGDISFSSIPNKGTTFHINLPI